jgi:negative regulator of genetic competence, sporulation and motility
MYSSFMSVALLNISIKISLENIESRGYELECILKNNPVEEGLFDTIFHRLLALNVTKKRLEHSLNLLREKKNDYGC